MPEIEYYACPLCGWCRSIKYGEKETDGMEKREVRFDKVDLDKAYIFQVRIGGGRASGFHLDEDRSLKLEDIDEEIKKQIKKQAKKILKILG